MRVLLVTGMLPSPVFPTNGLAVKRQVETLQDRGVEIDLFHLRGEQGGSIVTSARRLRKQLREHRYDLVHIHYGLKATLIVLFLPVPVVATYHGTDVNGWTWKGRQFFTRPVAYNTAALIVRNVSRFIDSVIVMTEEMKLRLPKSTQRKTTVIPMGVDTALFSQRDRQASRQALGWGSEPVIAFANHNNEPIKRQDIAEEVMMSVQSVLPNARLFIIRGIEYRQMPLVLSAADLLLVTSDKEGSPNIVRESIACGLPVISVPVGDVPDLLGRYDGAGAIVPRDTKAIAQQIIDTIRNPPRPDMKGAREALSREYAAGKVIEVYNRVLRNAPEKTER
jgi:glycosyltransferase involved in cell wall biosynthesis